MISEYINPKKDLGDIVPPLNVDNLKNRESDYWELFNSQYENWVWKEDIFCYAEINKILKIGKYLSPHRAQTGGKGEDCLDHRRSFVSWLNINQETYWIYQRLSQNIISINENWYDFELEKIETLQFTYYNSEEEGCYKPHVDPLCWQMPHNRKMSVVIQLSDPEDYEGGELLLHLGNEPHRIQRKKGLAVFFPSYILHEVTPVTKGERYSLVAWVHGKPFK